MLVLCLLALRGKSGPQVLHNWAPSTMRFTQGFNNSRAGRDGLPVKTTEILEPYALAIGLKALSAIPAMLLVVLPTNWIVYIVRWLVPSRISSLVLYCDAHLAGFAITLAMRRRGAATYTLHHGLYRTSDRGSVMGVRNMVSDQILLWDEVTCQEFEKAGFESDRLRIVGQYGFSDTTPDTACDDQLILICPPYDSAVVARFKALEQLLPGNVEARWSLHPMLRAAYSDYPLGSLATSAPRPKLAVCGDSGVLMEALGRHIPIITVSERPLSAAHLTYDEVDSASEAVLTGLIDLATESLPLDRAKFGFGQSRFEEQSAELPERGGCKPTAQC